MIEIKSATDLKDVLTGLSGLFVAASAVAGATLAAWKWYFEERIRRSREIQTIDGSVSVEIVKNNENSIAVFVDSQWNNKGTLAIFADVKTTVFRIFIIDTVEFPVSIDAKENYTKADACDLQSPAQGESQCAKLALTVRPIQNTDMFILEPGTESRIQASIVLRKGPLYELRATLVTHSGPDSSAPDLFWFRRKLFDSDPKPMS